ncbi:hypothetical protein ACCO45_010965 [Purpureocillium lilacinum]|uniref:Uncharacterized protein n=1 Tax=Purpureocillium lilacinum TaxID=33203 RepID=A0ACC4DGB1_PURLI
MPPALAENSIATYAEAENRAGMRKVEESCRLENDRIIDLFVVNLEWPQRTPLGLHLLRQSLEKEIGASVHFGTSPGQAYIYIGLDFAWAHLAQKLRLAIFENNLVPKWTPL